MTQPLEHLLFDKADEVREGEKWRLELLAVLRSGESPCSPDGVVRPCQARGRHRPVHGTSSAVQISGRMHVVMRDGTEIDSGPGEVMSLPPGHDAWVVVGDQPVVAIDWQGASVWARPQ